ncbi:MAG: glycosyltransferase [Clostridium sp.]
MNILMLGRSIDIGGTETMILNLSRKLKEKYNHNIYLSSAGGVLEKEFENIGIENIYFDDIDKKTPKDIIKRIKFLRTVIKDKNINIIHSHHRFLTMVANIAVVGTKTKVIHTAHYMSEKNKAGKLLGKNIIAVGNSVKTNLVEKSLVEANRVTVIHNGIEPNLSEKTECIEEFSGKNIGLTISRLSYEKGIDILLEAIPKVIEKNKDFRLLIIGDGELMQELTEKAEKLNINKYVKFLGSKKNIYDYINFCDFVIMPSRSEGLPVTPIEAFSKKKFVVATDCDGIKEVVEDGFSGIITQKDPAKLALGINDAIELKQKDIFKENAYKTFIDKFTLDKMASEYNNYYSKIGN